MPGTATKTLTEQFNAAGCKTLSEQDSGPVIRGIRAIAQQSRNGYRYSEGAISQTLKGFEGLGVTVRGSHDRSIRDYNSQNGILTNGHVERVENDQLASFFDWHLNASDPLTPKLLEDAERFPQNVIFSAEIGDWLESEDDEGNVTIETITEDRQRLGIALVFRGGTNNGLRESSQPKDKKMEINTRDDLRKLRPEIYDALLNECPCQVKDELADLKEKLANALKDGATAAEENETLKKRIAELEAEQERVKEYDEILSQASKMLGEDRAESLLIKDGKPSPLLESMFALREDKRYMATLEALVTEGDDGDSGERKRRLKSPSGGSYGKSQDKPSENMGHFQRLRALRLGRR